MIKLSIITINFNNENGLRKTIESVINQTYTDFEYIIIDGASNDGSKELIESYSNKITYWISEKDDGIYHAMNKGILIAKGEYVLFLNSGDWLIDKQILRKVISNIKNVGIVYGDGYIDHPQSKVLVQIPEHPNLRYFSKTSLFHPSSFIKRDLFNRFGLYNENNKIVSDWEFFIKTILINKVSYQKIPFIISVIEENGISRNPKHSQLLKDEIKGTLARYFSETELEFACLDNNKSQKVIKKNQLITRLLNFLKN